MAQRRFFSGRTVDQAILEAARHHGLEPGEVVYRLREAQGASRARGKTVIEVDPQAPDRADAADETILRAVEQVLEIAGLDLRPRPSGSPGEGLVVDLDGPDRDLVWEDDGEILRAAEVLAGLVVRQRDGSADWMLDCGGRRRARAEEIRRRALEAAAEVRRTGAGLVLEPQDAAERRLVHLALREVEGVRTESEGRGPSRRVRIEPEAERSGESPGGGRFT